MVYVLSKSGKPLMPCENVVARLLLKEKKAKVRIRCPFTIKLLYETQEHVRSLTLGVDTGSGTIGAAVSDGEGNIYYASEVEVRNDIKGKMDTRRKFRRSRRTRKTRYREPRFNNRANSKREGRLSPTVNSKIHSHEKEISFIMTILPVEKLVIEMGQFDMAFMKDPSIRSEKKIHWAYQKGPNYGFANIKAMVRARDGHTCQICKGKSGDKKLDVHHIIFRSNGGSDIAENLITLCHTCHIDLHKGNITLPKKKGKKKDGLSHASQMNVIRSQLLKHYNDVIETFGYVTSENRLMLGLEKGHYIDACVIASGGKKPILKTNTILLKKSVSEGDYQKRKGSRSEMPVAPKKILGFRKFDKVRYKGNEYFIKGRMASGYCVLMDIYGTTQKFDNPKTVKLSACQRISARKSVLTQPIHPVTFASLRGRGLLG